MPARDAALAVGFEAAPTSTCSEAPPTRAGRSTRTGAGIRSDAEPFRARDAGALSLVSTFLDSFPPSASVGVERKLASLPRVREDGVLTVDLVQEGEGLVIRASGELDIASAKALEDEVRQALEGDASAVVLDLGGLSFIDSGGLRALARSARHARKNGDRLGMLRGSGLVRRVIKMGGLESSLRFID